jgi:hypothetical protein
MGVALLRRQFRKDSYSIAKRRTTPSLQTNSNVSGVVLSNPVHLPDAAYHLDSKPRYWR